MTIEIIKDLIETADICILKVLLEHFKISELQKEVKIELDKRQKINKTIESWTKKMIRVGFKVALKTCDIHKYDGETLLYYERVTGNYFCDENTCERRATKIYTLGISDKE